MHACADCGVERVVASRGRYLDSRRVHTCVRIQYHFPPTNLQTYLTYHRTFYPSRGLLSSLASSVRWQHVLKSESSCPPLHSQEDRQEGYSLSTPSPSLSPLHFLPISFSSKRSRIYFPSTAKKRKSLARGYTAIKR